MLSSQIITDIQQAMNRLWFHWKKIRHDKNNLGLTDEEMKVFLVELMELGEKLISKEKTA
jgi:hypothetical protein